VRWRSEYSGVDARYGRGRWPVAPVSLLLVPGGRAPSGRTAGAARDTSPGPVPVPQWVKAPVDVWCTGAGINKGTVFRSINKSGSVWGDCMTPKVLSEVVKQAASRAGIEKLAPHDLRRTFARLCHLAGGELDQISSCSGTFRFKPPNDTSDASRGGAALLATSSELSLSAAYNPSVTPGAVLNGVRQSACPCALRIRSNLI
jgi:hypothetical protein